MRLPRTLTRVYGSRVFNWSRADGPMLEGMLVAGFALQAVYGLVLPLLVVLGVRAPDASRIVSVVKPGSANLIGLRGWETTLTVADPGIGQRLLLELPGMFVSILILLGTYWVFLIARTFRGGDPFVPANSRRIYRVALLVFPGYAIGELIEKYTNDLLIAETALQGRAQPALDLSLQPVVVFFLVVALAEMFRLGTRLRDDVEGLV